MNVLRWFSYWIRKYDLNNCSYKIHFQHKHEKYCWKYLVNIKEHSFFLSSCGWDSSCLTLGVYSLGGKIWGRCLSSHYGHWRHNQFSEWNQGLNRHWADQVLKSVFRWTENFSRWLEMTWYNQVSTQCNGSVGMQSHIII